MRRFVVRRALGTAAVLAVALGVGTTTAAATPFVPGPVGSDDFKGSQHYTGDFPDPSVLKAGSTYVAYSTTIGNRNLPVLTSPDLKTWTALPGQNGNAYDNDALRLLPTWANTRVSGDRRIGPTWAPDVTRIGDDYVHVYATQLKDKSRFCISISRSTSPLGPFVDSSKSPLLCPKLEGAIDPYLWTTKGKVYVLYKTEGIRGQVPTRLWSRQMSADATRILPGSKSYELLRTAPGTWEGDVIENPAMVRYLGHYYLFYSANSWSSDRYATGYAICRGPLGPCTRPGGSPLLHTTGNIAGPGGGSPFVDAHGYFRLAYHSWTTGYVGYPKTDACESTKAGCPQRRMRIARLVAAKDHTLRVASYVMK